MSEENIEVIGRFYECLARRDWDAMWRDFDPDFMLDTQLQGSYRGRDECQALKTRSVHSSPRRRSPCRCSRAASTSRSSSRCGLGPRGSGAEIETLVGHLFTMRDGLIVRLQTFPQREKALEAAGLSE